MYYVRRRSWAAATVGVAVIGTFVTVALASHTPFNFTTTPLVTGNLANDVKLNSDRIKFQTKDPTDVRVPRIDIAPGGYSGWHHHPGIVIVSVLSGQVTFTNSDCSSTTYGPGLPAGAPRSSRAAMIRARPRASVGQRSMRRLLRRTPFRPSSELRTLSSLLARNGTSCGLTGIRVSRRARCKTCPGAGYEPGTGAALRFSTSPRLLTDDRPGRRPPSPIPRQRQA